MCGIKDYFPVLRADGDILCAAKSKAWLSSCSVIQGLLPKTIGNRKKKLCVRLRSGDKHHLRKSADRNAQIRPVSGTNAFLIVLFDLQIFSGGVYPPSATSPRHNLFFLFPIVFGIWFIFSMRRRTVQPEIKSFFFGASIPCHAIWQR